MSVLVQSSLSCTGHVYFPYEKTSSPASSLVTYRVLTPPMNFHVGGWWGVKQLFFPQVFYVLMSFGVELLAMPRPGREQGMLGGSEVR